MGLDELFRFAAICLCAVLDTDVVEISKKSDGDMLLVGGSAALLLWWSRVTVRREVGGTTKVQPRLFQGTEEAEEVAPCRFEQGM